MVNAFPSENAIGRVVGGKYAYIGKACVFGGATIGKTKREAIRKCVSHHLRRFAKACVIVRKEILDHTKVVTADERLPFFRESISWTTNTRTNKFRRSNSPIFTSASCKA